MLQGLGKFKLLLGVIILVLLVAIPITLTQLGKRQETRSRASGGAVALSFSPGSSEVPSGQNFSVKVKMNTADNDVSAVDITFTYDSSILGLVGFHPASTFATVTNTAIDGSMHYVGVNPTSTRISGTDVDLGVIEFKANRAGIARVGFSNVKISGAGVSTPLPLSDQTSYVTYTVSSTPISSGSLIGSYDWIGTIQIGTQTGNYHHTLNITSEDKKAGTFSGTGFYNDDPAITWNITGTENWADMTMTFNMVYTGKNIPYTVTGKGSIRGDGSMDGDLKSSYGQTGPWKATPINTYLSFQVELPGVGPTTDKGMNNKPRRPQRKLDFEIYDSSSNDTPAYKGTITNLTFNQSTGLYGGQASLGVFPKASGSFMVKVRMDNTLKKRTTGVVTITKGIENKLPTFSLVSGDFNQDNILSLLDYNILVSCTRGITCKSNVLGANTSKKVVFANMGEIGD